jgi:hypothetical protein
MWCSYFGYFEFVTCSYPAIKWMRFGVWEQSSITTVTFKISVVSNITPADSLVRVWIGCVRLGFMFCEGSKWGTPSQKIGQEWRHRRGGRSEWTAVASNSVPRLQYNTVPSNSVPRLHYNTVPSKAMQVTSQDWEACECCFCCGIQIRLLIL